MHKNQVREQVNAELFRRGHTQPQTISNKKACVLLGLMPEGTKGIGTTNGRKLLKAWVTGEQLSYEQLLIGTVRENKSMPRPEFPPHQAKKVVRAKAKKRWAQTTFYESREWLELRYRVLQKNGARCQCCGQTYREHGVVLHVDHIKPRSLHPELELDFANMQVLCEACNLGKSNKDDTDWRPRLVVDNSEVA